MLALIVVIAGAYLLGSIPTGYLVALLRGVDLRAHGSGNIGATNVFRTLGKPLGIFVHDHIIIGKNGHTSMKGQALI